MPSFGGISKHIANTALEVASKSNAAAHMAKLVDK